MPTPHLEREKEKREDVFNPPYNPNLYVGELRDEDEGIEYAVLVSEFGFLLFVGKLRECEPTPVVGTLALFALPHPIALDACFVAQQVLCR